MTVSQAQKFWISIAGAAALVLLFWVLSFSGHLNVVALLIALPYLVPLLQSLDPMTRIYITLAAPVIQFMLYALLVWNGWRSGRAGKMIMVVAGVHVLAVVVCYRILASYD